MSEMKEDGHCRPHWRKGIRVTATHYSGDMGHDGPTRCADCRHIVCVTCGADERQADACGRCNRRGWTAVDLFR